MVGDSERISKGRMSLCALVVSGKLSVVREGRKTTQVEGTSDGWPGDELLSRMRRRVGLRGMAAYAAP